MTNHEVPFGPTAYSIVFETHARDPQRELIANGKWAPELDLARAALVSNGSCHSEARATIPKIVQVVKDERARFEREIEKLEREANNA
jgi:hypothetical protein